MLIYFHFLLGRGCIQQHSKITIHIPDSYLLKFNDYFKVLLYSVSRRSGNCVSQKYLFQRTFLIHFIFHLLDNHFTWQPFLRSENFGISPDMTVLTYDKNTYWMLMLLSHILNVHNLFLYPTQRVAEGIMFLTRPSVSQSVSPSVLFFLLAQLLWNRWTEFPETL